MGTWGVVLYENDTASDVRDAWLKKIREGASGEVETKELLGEWSGANDEPLFWLALADTQWTWGRLEAHVREHAERVLAAGADLSLWEQSKDRDHRHGVPPRRRTPGDGLPSPEERRSRLGCGSDLGVASPAARKTDGLLAADKAMKAGISGDVVSASLGHESFAVTEKHYSGSDAVAGARIDRVATALN